jgi:hypothetical protein
MGYDGDMSGYYGVPVGVPVTASSAIFRFLVHLGTVVGESLKIKHTIVWSVTTNYIGFNQ